MQVIDHEPHAWFLFKKDEDLLLDVNCSHSAAGYGILIPLSSEEAQRYFQNGRPYLDQLAQEVQNSGPGRGLQLRDVSAEFSKESRKAVEEWRRCNPSQK